MGAPEVTGVDISGAMNQLTEEEANLHPLGCTCRRHDAVTFETCRRVYLVLASYLLHCARTADELRRLCATCQDALGQEGRMVCLIANVANSREGLVSWKRYGVEKLCPWTRRDGGTIKVRITNSDGSTFEFENCCHSPETYRLTFADSRIADFHWVGLSLRAVERGNPYWDDYMNRPPDDAFSASRSRHRQEHVRAAGRPVDRQADAPETMDRMSAQSRWSGSSAASRALERRCGLVTQVITVCEGMVVFSSF